MEVALHLIDWTDDANGRETTDTDHVERLARQIQHVGLLHAITVQPSGDRYKGIAGRHRFLAFQRLNRHTIPVTVLDKNDPHAPAIRFLENVTRKNLSPIEEATQLALLVNTDNAGVDTVATDIGRTADWILSRLELLNFPPRLQDHLHAKRISIAAARILARVPDPAERDQYIEAAANHGCSARTAQLWLQNATGAQPGQTQTSDFSVVNDAERTTITTTVVCYGCDANRPLADTRPYRICHQCALAINNAKTQTPTTPPATPEPPRREPAPPQTLDNTPPQP